MLRKLPASLLIRIVQLLWGLWVRSPFVFPMPRVLCALQELRVPRVLNPRINHVPQITRVQDTVSPKRGAGAADGIGMLRVVGIPLIENECGIQMLSSFGSSV